jgi:hypothetical protein
MLLFTTEILPNGLTLLVITIIHIGKCIFSDIGRHEHWKKAAVMHWNTIQHMRPELLEKTRTFEDLMVPPCTPCLLRLLPPALGMKGKLQKGPYPEVLLPAPDTHYLRSVAETATVETIYLETRVV